MPVFLPFKALMPHPEYAQHTILDQDYIFDSESEAFERQFNPYSFWPVLRPVGYEPSQREEFEAALDASLKRFQQFIADGIFQEDEEECFYIYQTSHNQNEQVGLIGLVSVEDYRKGHIKKHENTRTAREEQLSEFLETVGINTTPVHLTYRNVHEVEEIIFSKIQEPAYITAKGINQIMYSIWRVSEPDLIDRITELFNEIPDLYIADGHHRAACANLSALKRGNENLNLFSAVAISADKLSVYPFYRLLKKDEAYQRETYLEQLKKNFKVKEVNLDQQYYQFLSHQQFVICFQDTAYELTPRLKFSREDLLSDLDVSILQDEVLAPIFGIENPSTDTRIAFGSKNVSLNQFKRLLLEPTTECIFLCRAPEVETILDVADQNGIMPPKSTSFEPKILSGLVMQQL